MSLDDVLRKTPFFFLDAFVREGEDVMEEVGLLGRANGALLVRDRFISSVRRLNTGLLYCSRFF